MSITIDAGGEPRHLDPIELTLAPVNEGMFRSPVASANKIEPVNLQQWLPPVGNQNGVSMCNASTTVEQLMAIRSYEGQEYVALSAGNLYSRIASYQYGDGGGSLPERAQEAITMIGVTSEADVPYLQWQASRQPADWKIKAKKYRMDKSKFLKSTDDMLNAFADLGFVNICMAWSDGDSNTDAAGFIGRRTRGNVGGHSILGYGWDFVRPSNDPTDFENMFVWAQNHWTIRFGLQGRFKIPMGRIALNFADFRMFTSQSSIQGEDAFL